jgi:hypothetical protein
VIYTPDWESLANALQRVASAHNDLPGSKAAICNAISDKKIAVRVIVDPSHDRHGGMTFAGGNIAVPFRLVPGDFDWANSRPLRQWEIGPRPIEHYTWIGGWRSEPISLIELRTADVTRAFLGKRKERDVEVISRVGASRLVGAAMFRIEWVGRLKRRERHLLDHHGAGPPPQSSTLYRSDYDPFAEMHEGEEHGETERARDRYWLMQWQYERVNSWLRWKGFTGRKFPREKFDKVFVAEFSQSQKESKHSTGHETGASMLSQDEPRSIKDPRKSHRKPGRRESYDASALRTDIEVRLKEGPFPSREAWIRWCLEPGRVKLRPGEKPPIGKRRGDAPDRHTLEKMIERYKLGKIQGLLVGD